MPRITAAQMASNHRSSADWCNGCGLHAYVHGGEHRADCTRDKHEPKQDTRTR